MLKKERYRLFADYSEHYFPEPETELKFQDPFQLLICVILSAQCTDKRVNLVAPALFKKFPTPESFIPASFDDVFPFIKSISYPNNKTRHIIGTARMLVEKFNSKVPSNVDDLQKLPGVGRKTAHVVASVVFGQPVMAVDTHVFRVAKRLGLVSQTANTPLAVEKELTANLPQELIHSAHHWLILHGRYICTARKPSCDSCYLKMTCRYYELIVQTRKNVRN
jgi:endonuclease-3